MEQVINNEIYNELNERWYSANDDPVALLRAESKLVAPWIHNTAQEKLGAKNLLMADLGCGGGFVSNKLAKYGHKLTAIDLSENSLDIARKYDETKSIDYRLGDVTKAPLESEAYDVVVSLDVLEHVDEPEKLVSEAYRLLKPGGVFFFHTFNRNFLSYLVVIKFVEWFVRNTPDHMHLLSMFVKPAELQQWCENLGFGDFYTIGMRPSLRSLMDKSVLKRTVPEDLAFKFTSNTWMSYAGYTVKGSK